MEMIYEILQKQFDILVKIGISAGWTMGSLAELDNCLSIINNLS